MDQPAWKFWNSTVERVVEGLDASPGGLTSEEVRQRLALYGRNHLKLRKRSSALRLLLAQFKSPLIIILLLAAVLSFFLGENVDALIIVGIVLLSGLLGFWQEKKAADAVEKLLAIVSLRRRPGRRADP
jgi:Mg2+-importing ATPase